MCTLLEGPWRLQVEWRELVLRNGADKGKEEGVEADRRKRCGVGEWEATVRQEVHGQEPKEEKHSPGRKGLPKPLSCQVSTLPLTNTLFPYLEVINMARRGAHQRGPAAHWHTAADQSLHHRLNLEGMD